LVATFSANQAQPKPNQSKKLFHKSTPSSAPEDIYLPVIHLSAFT